MKVSPVVIFWISLITTVGQGIASGTVHLSGLVPTEWIPYVTGWLGLIVFANMAFLTALNGFSSSKSGLLASAPTLDEARAVMKEATAAAPNPQGTKP